MTAISSLTNVRPSLPHGAAGRDVARAARASTAAPSAIVSLSVAGLAAAQQAQGDTGPARISTAMLFRDAGAAVLERFRTGATVALDQPPLPKDSAHQFTLGVLTARGTKVDLALASHGDGLLVQLSADGALDDDERDALAGLAEGFQKAIDGMTAVPPRLRLEALAQLDTGALQSIDLHAAVTLPTTPPALQSLDVQLDSGQRSVKVDGPSGQLDLAVQTDMLESLGTRQQQAKAIDSYLKQFDQAAARGHGDPGLMTMFKDAFSDLSRTASREDPATVTATASAGKPWFLSRENRAVLTGLADFTASVTQTPQWINPVHRDEVDSFKYEVSQQLHLGGQSRADRAVGQVQQSRLTAQFHEPLQEGGQLAFDFSAETQNYRYRQVDDSARSSVELGYRDGRLRHATLEQSVSQSERIREYVLGRVMSDRTVPAEQHLVRDLLAALSPYQAGKDGPAHDANREAREQRRMEALDALSDNVFLLGSATDLSSRQSQV